VKVRSAAAFFLIIVLLAGCVSSVRMPDDDESAAIRQNNKALVLMRFDTQFENKPVKPFDFDGENLYMLKSTSFEGDRKLRNLWPFRSPSEEAHAEGWVYFLLEPGSHYIYAKPPPFSKDIDAVRKYRTFWLTVPKNQQVVYAGSFTTNCRSMRLIFSSAVADCRDLQVIDESSKAQTVAEHAFPEYGTMAASLALSYPPSNIMQAKGDLLPLELVVHGLPRFASPEWSKRGISRATGIGGTSDEEPGEPMRGGLGGGDPRFGAGLVMLYILYLPIGLTTGAITGALNEGRWGECIQALDAGVRQIGIEQLLTKHFEPATALKQADTGRPDETGNRPRSQLELTVHRLAIRECSKRNTFCPEIAVRATLRLPDKQETVYDTVFAYSDNRIEAETPAYWISKANGPACRELGEYCDEKGKQSFYDEVLHGLQEISDRVLRDLGVQAR